ncbi:hypothetical protein [Rubrolithibacter danxiaensis]|uniref:hypothetical protein n=1 Tax=Rubrolithibacter danxiaensis TaxID=3390805 RepID=UPI003BF8FFFA
MLDTQQNRQKKLQSFKISYFDEKGDLLTGIVKQISKDDYEVFVKEKGVVIHCIKGENGTIVCNLNSVKNLPWIEGISKEVEKELSLQL